MALKGLIHLLSIFLPSLHIFVSLGLSLYLPVLLPLVFGEPRQTWKHEKKKEGGSVGGGAGAPSPGDTAGDNPPPSPGCYHLVSGDLRDTAALEDRLRAARVDFSAPTVFLAECVLVYMEARESDALLRVNYSSA